jgi:predicted transcriptional regulator
MNNITTATVCRYVLERKMLSIRATAQLVGIHHRTMQRYLMGECRPSREVKYKIARLMQVKSFEELVRDAFQFYSVSAKNHRYE